jgi:DivIVA domain-containing protein
VSSQGQRFRRRALRRGYKVDEVDAFLDRVEATLSGDPIGAPVTAQEVHDVVFRVRFGGYDEWQVDLHLDRVERQLADAEERGGFARPEHRMASAMREERFMPVGPSMPAPPMPMRPIGAPMSGAPMSGAPMSGMPMSGMPMSGPPMRGMNGHPISAPPLPGRPMSGPPMMPRSPMPMMPPPMGAPMGSPLPPGPPPASHGPVGYPRFDDTEYTSGGFGDFGGGGSRYGDSGRYSDSRYSDGPRFDDTYGGGRRGRMDSTSEIRMPHDISGAIPISPSDYGSASPADVQRIDAMRRTFTPRRFGSGYDASQVNRLFDAIVQSLSGRSGMPLGPSELDPNQFSLVPGGYFEAEVNQALREVRDLIVTRY